MLLGGQGVAGGLEDEFGVDAGGDLDLADVGGQDEVDLAVESFLVGAEAGEEVFGGDAVEGGDGAELFDAIEDGVAAGKGQVAGEVGEAGGGVHTEGDGFAMEEAGVAGFGLEGVADGVAEVENAAEVAFFFVGGDDFALDADALADDGLEAGGVEGEDFGGVEGHFVEEGLAADDTALEDFVEAGAVFALGEGAEDFGVDQDGEGLVEAADEVFAGEEIDAGFAANGGVDLAEEGGGDLEDGDAAEEDGGEETGDVGNDAAAEADDEAGAVGAVSHHLFGEGFDLAEAFFVFAAGEEQDVPGAAGESGLDEGVVVGPDVASGDDEDLAQAGREELSETGEKVAFDDGVVLRRGGTNGIAGHLRYLYH